MMPQHYTNNQSYNEGVDAAMAMLARVANETGDDKIFAFYIRAANRICDLKRRTNRRRIEGPTNG